MIKYVLLALCLCSCTARPVNELDAMTKDVIKNKEGVDIRIVPIPQEGQK